MKTLVKIGNVVYKTIIASMFVGAVWYIVETIIKVSPYL